MKFCWILCVLTTVSFCDGSLLGGIINGAHEAAGAFLGGITSGVNFGFNAQGGHQRYPPRPNGPYRPGKPETVVVVVEDEPDQQQQQQHNQNGHGNFNKPLPNPGFNQNPYQYPNENGYGNQNSNNFNQNGNWNNHNQQNGQGQYGNQNVKPNHQFPPNPNNHQINPNNPGFNPYNQHINQNNQHSYSDNQNNQNGNTNNRPVNPNNQYGNTNNRPLNPNSQFENPNNQPIHPNNQFENNHNQYENPNNEHGNFNNQDQNKNPSNFGDIGRPSYSTERPNQGRPNNQGQTVDHGIVKPPVDKTMKFPGQINHGSSEIQKQNHNEHKTDTNIIKNNVGSSTKDPTGADEYPLFLPLSPNEYQYGGDKIEVNGPKLETGDSKPKPADDEEFQIDIRIDDK